MNEQRINEARQKLIDETTVYEVPIFDHIGKYQLDRNAGKIPGFKLIKRSCNDEPITVVSEKYKVFQNIEAFNSAITDLNNLGLNYELKNLTLNTGIRHNSMRTTFTFPEITFDVDGGDTVATMDIFNSTDGSLAFTEHFGAYRIICSNGLIVGKELFSQKRRHTKYFERIMISEEIDNILSKFNDLKELIEKSQAKRATDEFTKSLIKTGFPARVIMNLPETFIKYAEMYNETIKDYTKVWAYYAVLTNWITNVVAKRNLTRAFILNQGLMNSIRNDLK